MENHWTSSRNRQFPIYLCYIRSSAHRVIKCHQYTLRCHQIWPDGKMIFSFKPSKYGGFSWIFQPHLMTPPWVPTESHWYHPKKKPEPPDPRCKAARRQWSVRRVHWGRQHGEQSRDESGWNTPGTVLFLKHALGFVVWWLFFYIDLYWFVLWCLLETRHLNIFEWCRIS